jgi:hypothetical protein
MFYSFLVCFTRFWYVAPIKIWQPGEELRPKCFLSSKLTDGRMVPDGRNIGQGCQMVYFQTKNRNLGKLWRVLRWKMLVYFTAIWYVLWSFGIFYGHLVYFVVIWYIFPRFGTLYQEKSGNPGIGSRGRGKKVSLWGEKKFAPFFAAFFCLVHASSRSSIKVGETKTRFTHNCWLNSI